MSLTPTTNPTNALAVPAAAIPQEQMLASVAAQQQVMMVKMQEAMQALADNQSAKDKTIEDLKEQLTRTQAALTAAQQMNTNIMNVHKVETQALRDQMTILKKNALAEVSKVKIICERLENRYYEIGRKRSEGLNQVISLPRSSPFFWDPNIRHEREMQVYAEYGANNEALAQETVTGMVSAKASLDSVEKLLK